MRKIEKIEKTLPSSEKLEEFRSMFPAAFRDGSLDFAALQDLLGTSTTEGSDFRETLGLSWPGKREARRAASVAPTMTLRPVDKKSIDKEQTHNILIEGENLEVLRVLRKSYANRIKLIYIDPPYNTGNDFVYKDDFREPAEAYLRRTGQADEEGLLTSNPKTGGRFHSNWLNFMYPRLQLAADLLREDGTIFISIDDNEVHNLRTIMDEIFGEENFLAQVCWKKKYSPANDKTDFSATHEYLVVFAKSKKYSESGRTLALLNKLERTEKQDKIYKNPDNDPRGPWMSGDYTCNKTAEQRPNLYYPVVHPKTKNEIWPNKTRVWAYGEKEHQRNVAEKRIWWGLTQENETPRFKRFLSDVGGVIADTWWSHEDVGHTDEAKKEFKALFEDAADAFDTPKPLRLLRRILKLGTNTRTEEDSDHEDDDSQTEVNCQPDIVLDFFAGSGTLGHAVFEANAADCAERRFILVQIPEKLSEESQAAKAGVKTIFDVSLERLKRARAIIKKEKKSDVDLGFRVFSLAPSNVRKWNSISESSLSHVNDLFSQSSLVQGWKKEDLLTEIILLEGFPLDSKVSLVEGLDNCEVFLVSDPSIDFPLLVCLDKRFDRASIKLLCEFSNATFICIDEFLSDSLKLSLADAFRSVKTI